MTIKSKLTALTLVAAIAATTFVTAFADEAVEGEKKMFREDKPAIEMDYETMSEKHLERTGEELTEETFNKMQEAHELAQEGDFEAAKEIMDEVGIKPPMKGEMHGKREEFKKEFMESLTDEQKEVLEQSRELREEGDREAAKELLEEAGVELPERPRGEGRGECDCKCEA